MRYIDADALKERLEDFSKWCKDERKQGVDFVLDCALPNTPTADVVEVVRCKDCKHWCNQDRKDMIPDTVWGECHHPFGSYGCEDSEADDYCSFGERKE